MLTLPPTVPSYEHARRRTRTFGLQTSSLWQSLDHADVSRGPVGVSYRGMSGLAFRDPGAGSPRITAIVIPASAGRAPRASVMTLRAANDVNVAPEAHARRR